MERLKNVFFISISVALISLTACKDKTYYGVAPTIILSELWADKQELHFKVLVEPYDESEYVERIGVCISYTDEFPLASDISHTSANGYKTESESMFNVTPGQFYYIRPYVKIDDGYFYGETKTYEAPQVWEVIDTDFISLNNRVIDIISEDDIRFFSRYKQYKSTDQGLTWDLMPSGLPNLAIHFVEFYSSNEAVVVTEAGEQAVYRTTNGGDSWTLMSTIGESTVNTGAFLNLDQGYIIMSDNIARVTNDGGITWNTKILPLAASDEITAVFPINYDNAFLGTEEGSIFKTENAGLTWSLMNEFDSLEAVTDIYFLNGNHGFIVAGGRIYETTNGGGNFHLNFFEEDCQPIKITFVNDFEGFAVGESGSSMQTKNGGLDWVILTDESSYSRPDTYVNFDMLNSSFGMATTEDDHEFARYSY